MSLENELRESDFTKDFIVDVSYDSDGYEYWEMNKRGNKNSSVVLGYHTRDFTSYCQIYLFHEDPQLNRPLTPLKLNTRVIIQPDEQECLHFSCGDMMMNTYNFHKGSMNKLSLQSILNFMNSNL